MKFALTLCRNTAKRTAHYTGHPAFTNSPVDRIRERLSCIAHLDDV
jgi:hypothetical protein